MEGKRFFSFIISILLLLSIFTIDTLADSNITIYVNEQMLQCDVPPFINNGRTMVPMRKIFEVLDAKVEWEGLTQTIIATKNDTKIVLQINNLILYNNDVAEPLEVAPVIVNGSTFVPVRAISQSLDASIQWLEYTQSVYINSPITYERAYNDYIASTTEVTMYAPDGRTLSILASEAELYKSVGWYTEPVTIMYAADGRTLYVQESEIEAYKKVGWYLSPLVTMYAPDGRTIMVCEDEVYDYINVGWYQTYDEAQSAKAPSYSSNSDYTNQSNSGGNTVYRTPSGKRYHFDPDCGGKNSYQTTLQKAKNAGLTPCKKCAS